MDVHIQSRDGAEQLGSAALLAAFDDLMVSEYTLEPGTEPGEPHYQANHSDAFYVLDGELEFRIEGDSVRASAGTLVVAPRGAVHAVPGRDRRDREVPERPRAGRLRPVPAYAQRDAREGRVARRRASGGARPVPGLRRMSHGGA
jgi:hypothetical protein